MNSETTNETSADETSADETSASPRRRAPLIRVAAVVALALVAGVAVWLVLRGADETSSSSNASQAAAKAASVKQIKNLAASVHHPVFWLGPKAGHTYELTQLSNGTIYVRYLPAGTKVGTDEPYLTVVTYPFPGAYPAIKGEAARKGAVSVDVARGGLAVLDARYPESVHLAYPRVNYQVEVYDPTPARAMSLVSAGELAILGKLDETPPTTATTTATTAATGTTGTTTTATTSTDAIAPGVPSAASEADLKALADSIGHPIYWAGPQAGYTYELTQTSNGRVFVRYLPKGVNVGDPKAEYLTVATYPFPDAFAALKRTANGAATIKLPNGGIALVDGQYPQSIHLAYPGEDFQIEVFDPSPSNALQVVTSGEIAPVP